MQTNTKVTLYNRYYDPNTGTEIYQRTLINAVMWEDRKATNILASGGNLAADQAIIFIPTLLDHNYLTPIVWLALVDKSGNWTLQEDDIIVKGTLADTISASNTPSAVAKANDNVLRISTIDTFDMGSRNMRHWKVGAK